MTSLYNSPIDLDRWEVLQESTLESYQSAIDSMRQDALRPARHNSATNLRGLRNELLALAKGLDEVTGSLAATSEPEKRLRLEILNLRALSQIDNAAQLRESVPVMAANLRQAIHEVKDANRTFLAQLRGQMRTGQKSGGCSREIEDQVRERIAGTGCVCLALIRLRNLPALLESADAGQAEEVLEAFEKRLAHTAKVAPQRRSEDEFIAILPMAKNDAMNVVKELDAKLSGTYVSGLNGHTRHHSLQVRIGLVEHRPGESTEQLLARSGMLMRALRVAA